MKRKLLFLQPRHSTKRYHGASHGEKMHDLEETAFRLGSSNDIFLDVWRMKWTSKANIKRCCTYRAGVKNEALH